MTYTFYCSCVYWSKGDVDSPGGLCDLISQARTITRSTFLRHVSRSSLRELEAVLGYSAWFPMSIDRCVTYYRSKHHGEVVYYFRHSAIEYVFKQPQF